jgi:hypothetical protein
VDGRTVLVRYLDERGRDTTLWPSFSYAYRRRARRFEEAAYQLTP